jgi:hypothetical protein
MQADTSTGEPVPITTYHLQGEDRGGQEICPKFSPDGEWLLCVMGVYVLGAWQTRDQQRIDLPIAGEILDVVFSPTGERLAVVHDECTSVLEWPSCREVARFSWPSQECYFEFVGADHLLLKNDDQLKLWNVNTGAVVLDWSTWKTGAFLIYDRRGDLVALAEDEQRDYLWAINLRTRERTLACGYKGLSHRPLQFTRDMRRVLICTEYQPASYELWDMEVGHLCGQVTRADFKGVHPIMSADGRYLVGETRSCDALMVWDILDDRLAQRIELGGRYPPLAVSPTHLLAAVIANRAEDRIDRTLFVDFSTGVCLGETSGHVQGLGGGSFSPCGRWFGSAVPDLNYSRAGDADRRRAGVIASGLRLPGR